MSNEKQSLNFLPLKLSKKDFLQYKEELDKFLSIKKDEYKNLFESFEILKQKKFHLSYLLFSYYNSWIFPYISYNKITRGNIYSSTFEISFIFKKLRKNMNCPFDEKLFILWYFYIYYNFFVKEKNLKSNALINQFRYILLETGKILINFLEQKLLSLQSVINILDINLLCFEYFIANAEFQQSTAKRQRLRKLIFFLHLFHLLKKISIITMKQNNDFEKFLEYLDKFKKNSEINDETNITLLFNNNILQDFIQNLLDNMNIVELTKAIPNLKKKLVNFCAHFLINRYKASKTFNMLQDTLKNSFAHLYNFKQNKDLIIKDIFKINFNTTLLNKFFNISEKSKAMEMNGTNKLNSSFYYDSKKSVITVENRNKLQLDQVIIFFSFQYGNIDVEHNQEIPLLLVFGKNSKKAEKNLALKIFLKKSENEKFKLYISQPKDDNMKILNEDSDIIINKNQFYYCAFYLFGKKIKIFLYDIQFPEIYKKEMIFNPIKEEMLVFHLGKDEKDSNFHKGIIGPLIIIKAPKTNNLDKLIEDILLLAEKYEDFIIIKSDLSKTHDLKLKNYFGNEFLEETIDNVKIKGNFDCLLYLNPESLRFYKYKMLDEKPKMVPEIYNNSNQNYHFIISNLNITILNDENFNKLFLADNGINYFCLLFEYFDQLFRYYLLKKDKGKIFEDNEMKTVLNLCIESIIINLVMSSKNNYSKYIYNSSKNILNNLYNCILDINKIEPIFLQFYQQLLLLKNVVKDVLMNYINDYNKEKINLTKYDLTKKKDYEKYNKYKFIDFNAHLFIGIIEILLTPEFYNCKNSKINIEIIDKIFDKVVNEIKSSINMIDITFISNIFYKFLSFIDMMNNHFSKNEKEMKNEIIIDNIEDKKEIDKYKKIVKNIFRLLIQILDSKYERNEVIVRNYFHKLFLFVFGLHINNYDLIMNYLKLIDEESSKLKFEEPQIIELKNILFKFENLKDNKDKDDKNKENIDIKEETILTIQSYIINKIYEFIFLNQDDNCPIKIDFLEELIKNKKFSKYLLIEIQNLLNKYFVNIFNDDEKNISSTFLNLKFSQLNKYFKKIFEFLKFFLKIMDKETIKHIGFIYDLMYKAQANIKIQEKNFEKCILFLINYIEFLYVCLNDNFDIEQNFKYHEPKIIKIIEELYDKCVESTLIHCDYYLKINGDKNINASTQEKKLIPELFFDIYINLLVDIYNIYRIPEKNKNEINGNDIAFIISLNSFFGEKLISEFNFEVYDIKNLPYIQKSKSIFFSSDFIKLLSHHQKYYKKYSKNKFLQQQVNYYNAMNKILDKEKPDFLDTTNKFQYFHTTYYFYKLYELYNTQITSYIKDEEIKKHEEIKKNLEEAKSGFLLLNNIILNDHFKLNLISKDYYHNKRPTDDSNLKNMLKSIQVIIFDKNYKFDEKEDLTQKIEKEFKTNEIKNRKSKNSRDSSGSSGSNSKKRLSGSFGSKDSSDGINGTFSSSYSNIMFSEINNEQNDFDVVNENNIKIEENPSDKIEKKEMAINESFTEQIEFLKGLIQKSHTKNIMEKLDKLCVINPKKEFMKKIFGVYFSDSFFENATFKKLKTLYFNQVPTSDPTTKLLNYPSKIKNFTNGLEPSYFLKDFKKFFITKIFTISHQYFYDYMCKHNLLNDSIVLLKSNLLNPENIDESESIKFNCELIKTDKVYYGNIINSEKEKFLLFSRGTYELFDPQKDANTIINEIKERGFTLSSLKNIETKNTKENKEKIKNILLDVDIFPNEEINLDKKVLIFYDDIEEIVERRILYSWQGLEIFLKNGKSYMFNMVSKENLEKLSSSLKTINNILFREQKYLRNKQEIPLKWKRKQLDTYEYLLYINKYGSRSLNDINQYYIFPWILLDFSNIDKINKNEKEIFQFLKKKTSNKINKPQNKDNKDKDIQKLTEGFRNFKFPVSVQIKEKQEIKLLKYNDKDEDRKYKFHHGTHYSTASYVDYFLMRNEPYNSLIVELQNYSMEDPNRLLLRLKDTVAIMNSGYDNRELIPELFSKIDCCVNINCGFFGYKKSGELVDDIYLIQVTKPKKIYNKISLNLKFIIDHKKLLNSDAVALKINKWIDNVFGVMQIPPQKKIEKSLNIFPKSTYENYNNLETKLEKLSKKYEGDSAKIIKKFINKINIIISFGQCPYQIFTEEHKNRELIVANSEGSSNYGLKNDYQGTDFIDTYMQEQLKNDNIVNPLNYLGIYFETNPLLEKIFILSDSSKLTIVDTNIYNLSSQTNYNWISNNDIDLPHICLFDKIEISSSNNKNKNFYIYNLKYVFSSFPPNNDKPSYYLYANENINTPNINQINPEAEIEKFKLITCRHIDNSFKLHFITLKNKKFKEIETYTHICEDFVMCCKALSHNSFIIGLRNGKLIKAVINEFIDNNKVYKNPSQRYDIIFDKYITGHLGSINVLEIDERLGIVISGGNDNKIFIRKLIDFELLTCIKLKPKFVITMAKVSPTNLLYVICFNRNIGKSIIFGYSLSGLKFAKSDYSLYTNIEFTSCGNIITLENQSNLKLLYGYNLQEIEIDEKDKEYTNIAVIFKSFNNNEDSVGWIQFNDFKKYYGTDRSVISFTKTQGKSGNIYQTLKVTNISFFE